MAKVEYLPKSATPPTSQGTVVIKVISQGGGGIRTVGRFNQMRVSCRKDQVEGLIQKFSDTSSIETIYVLGYDEARDIITPLLSKIAQAKNRPQRSE